MKQIEKRHGGGEKKKPLVNHKSKPAGNPLFCQALDVDSRSKTADSEGQQRTVVDNGGQQWIVTDNGG